MSMMVVINVPELISGNVLKLLLNISMYTTLIWSKLSRRIPLHDSISSSYFRYNFGLNDSDVLVSFVNAFFLSSTLSSLHVRHILHIVIFGLGLGSTYISGNSGY